MGPSRKGELVSRNRVFSFAHAMTARDPALREDLSAGLLHGRRAGDVLYKALIARACGSDLHSSSSAL